MNRRVAARLALGTVLLVGIIVVIVALLNGVVFGIVLGGLLIVAGVAGLIGTQSVRPYK